MVLAPRTSHPYDRLCRSDFRCLRTAAHDNRRRVDAVKLPDASAVRRSSRDDDKADKAVANDYGYCAGISRNQGLQGIASVPEKVPTTHSRSNQISEHASALALHKKRSE